MTWICATDDPDGGLEAKRPEWPGIVEHDNGRDPDPDRDQRDCNSCAYHAHEQHDRAAKHEDDGHGKRVRSANTILTRRLESRLFRPARDGPASNFPRPPLRLCGR